MAGLSILHQVFCSVLSSAHTLLHQILWCISYISW